MSNVAYRARQFEKLLHTVNGGIPELRDNFDGYGGIPPSKETLSSVVTLLAYVRNSGLPAPRSIRVAGDGEVGLIWNDVEAHSAYAEFCIDADDFTTTYGIIRSHEGKFRGFDEIKISSGFPDEVVTYLLNNF